MYIYVFFNINIKHYTCNGTGVYKIYNGTCTVPSEVHGAGCLHVQMHVDCNDSHVTVHCKFFVTKSLAIRKQNFL